MKSVIPANYPAWNEKLYGCLSLHTMRINYRDVSSYKIMTHCSRLPDPTGTRFFVSSKICFECCKVIPLSAAGTSLDSFLWPETSCGTEHNLLALLHPIPRLDRCDGQTVVSEELTGFKRTPLLAKIGSISVSTPENCKKHLWLPLHHRRHLQYQVKNKTFFFCWS